jgi:hypothetical protein
VAEAPAINEPTPVNPEKDPNAGPDAELSAVVELNMPDPTPGENESAFMDRCMTETSMIKEYPDQDKRQTACKLRFTSKTELNMPDPTPSENEDAYMDRCMTDRAMVKEYPDQDKRQVACKLRFTAKTELNMPDPTLGESEDAFMDRCMTETSMIKEYPDQDKRQVACKLRFTSKTNLSNKPETEAFIMKDDPDFNLSAKELDMVAKAVGLKDKKPRTIRKK